MRTGISCHRSITALGFCLLFSVAPSRLLGADTPRASVTTHTYKKVGDLKIKLDIHRGVDTQRGVVVWIHGGALINGQRAAVSQLVRDQSLRHGYAVVSIDYRLAPETKLPEIVRDVEDAFAWIRANGQRLKLNTRRIAVAGGSAGGYLTLLTGHRVKPRPTVLISFWGYGDLVGDWYSRPSKHARHNRRKISADEAMAQVSGPPISDARKRKGNGSTFYLYCRQQGLWPSLVSGWDVDKELNKFVPYMPLRNVTRDYPPTMLIHGKRDTDVPFRQSVMVAEEFRKHDVPYHFAEIDDGEHGLHGGDKAQVRAAYEQFSKFLNRYMQAK